MILLQRLQSLRFYRAAARRLAGRRVTYRPALPTDSPDLARLYGNPPIIQTNDYPIAHLADQGTMLLACLGEQVAGAITLRRFPPTATHYPDWWLFDLQVRLRYRGLGLGQGLVLAALAEAAARGAARVHLLVFAAQTPAIHLYEKLGFRLSTIPGLSEVLAQEAAAGARPRLIMTCDLDPSTTA
jgi:ribosomal protein S18 acetylase RimI-like enzyme